MQECSYKLFNKGPAKALTLNHKSIINGIDIVWQIQYPGSNTQNSATAHVLDQIYALEISRIHTTKMVDVCPESFDVDTQKEKKKKNLLLANLGPFDNFLYLVFCF